MYNRSPGWKGLYCVEEETQMISQTSDCIISAPLGETGYILRVNDQ